MGTETSALAMATTTGTDKKQSKPTGTAPLRLSGRNTVAALAAVKANADRRALKLARTIAAIRAKGAMSLKEVADELNRQCISSARGGRWYPSTVRDLEARIQRQIETGNPNPNL
jgi:hypothetical protein